MSDSWHYSRGGQALGPVSWGQLQQFAASGGLSPGDLVWTEGMAAWLPASQIPNLFGQTPNPYGQQNAYSAQPQYAPPPAAPLGYQTPNQYTYQAPPPAAYQDSSLNGGEWLLCILCGDIGCIVGIVYLCTGNPKGGKMLGFSILFSIIKAAIVLMIQAANH